MAERRLFEWCGYDPDFRANGKLIPTEESENDANIGIPRTEIPIISAFAEMCLTVPCYSLLLFIVLAGYYLKRASVTGRARTIFLTLLLSSVTVS